MHACTQDRVGLDGVVLGKSYFLSFGYRWGIVCALMLDSCARLRKSLKQHNSVEGVGQLANHTCCDTHWNANLEVASIDHYEETGMEPLWGFCAPNTTSNKILKS